jgi:hypothetical protein
MGSLASLKTRSSVAVSMSLSIEAFGSSGCFFLVTAFTAFLSHLS